MTAALVERLAPEDLWELLQRVVPPPPKRPQVGGHRRRGDQGELAAIIFVATSGCTWNQLPPRFGLSGVTAFPRFTEGPRPGCGPSSTAWSWTSSAPAAGWTGRAARPTPSVSGLSKGTVDGTESDRPLQEGIENPPHRRPPRFAAVDRHLRREPPRQPGPDPAGPRYPTHPLTPRPRLRRPGKLHGDKGYDYRHLRRWLSSRGIRHRLARKGIESSQRLGKHRWVVERTVSCLSGCRRLHRRCERKPEHFLAFTAIAATLIATADSPTEMASKTPTSKSHTPFSLPGTFRGAGALVAADRNRRGPSLKPPANSQRREPHVP